MTCGVIAPVTPKTSSLLIATAMETSASVATTQAPVRPDAINNDSRITPEPVVLPARNP